MVKAKNDKEKSLEDLKSEYKKIQERFNLPSFVELNRDFQIEKIAGCETDFLIREVKRFIAEKFSNYLRFIEAILNPVNTPMFIFSLIKSLSLEDKKRLSEIYKKMAKNEIRAIDTDINFSEEKDADFIKESFNLWQEIKKEMKDVIEIVKKNWDNDFGANNKGYFG
jgi:hypothetical protein